MEKKVAVIYCTHIINNEVEYFINNGYIKNSVADFYVCFNGDFPIETYKINAGNLGLNNLFFHNRKNTGHDFSGWAYVLFIEKFNKKIYELYDYYIFINSSCMGPFVPLYVKNNWVELFTNMITNDIKLVGPTINLYYGRPHIQSYMMCTDRIGIDIAIRKNIFTKDGIANMGKHDIIENYEIGFSKHILEEGYDIKSLLKAYEEISPRRYFETKNFANPSNLILQDDNAYDNQYCGISFHPYEVIFFKSNRDISPTILKTYRTISSKDNLFSKIIITTKTIKAKYGTNIKDDVSYEFNEKFINCGKIIIPKSSIFNEYFGDNYPNYFKQLEITIEDVLNPNLKYDKIIIDEHRTTDLIYKF